MDFDVVVFDTAPTGHTLRLLQFPSVLEATFGKIMGLKNTFAPMLGQLGGLLGMGNVNTDETMDKMEETMITIRKINKQFKDPVSLPTF